MQVSAKTFRVQKAGSSIAEYEDASWPTNRLNNGQGSHFRFAVADGATESSYAKIWARQLVGAFRKGLIDDQTICERLPDLQRCWLTIVNKQVMAQRRPLPWYVEKKIRDGAFAAILGLSVYEDVPGEGYGKWQAIALGDSCVVHMREEQVLTRFPLDNSASFSNRPQLLSSIQAHNNSVLKHLRTMESTWERGDVFYLMTDALAYWFMKEIEVGQMPWTFLRGLDPDSPTTLFHDWVERLRAGKLMRNDDVTLVLVNLLS